MAKKRGPYGERMIKVTVRFFTDEVPPEKGLKTAMAKGRISLAPNEYRGIKRDTIFFNGYDQFMQKFKELRERNGIKLLRPEKIVETDLS